LAEQSLTVEANMSDISKAVAAQLIADGTFLPAKRRQKHVKWENMLAREYIEKFYNQYPHWYRIEVGALPKGFDNAMFTKVRRYADAIVRMPDHVLIIEMKMLAKPDVVAQILNYIDLFNETPMFEKYWKEPVKGKVVAALCDEATTKFINKHGIELEIYKPSNYETWYNQKITKKE
jgi:hypothetical protein